MVGRLCSGTRSGNHLVRMSNISFFEAPLVPRNRFHYRRDHSNFFKDGNGTTCSTVGGFLGDGFFRFRFGGHFCNSSVWAQPRHCAVPHLTLWLYICTDEIRGATMKSARTANREMPLRDRPDGVNRRPVLPARVVYAL